MTPEVDRSVQAILDYLNTLPLTGGETVAVLARALLVWLEAIPLEDRPPLLAALARALDTTLDVIEVAYADLLPPAPPVIRH